MPTWLIIVLVIVALLAVVVVHDLTQKRHAILRNFPIIGHLRYILEKFGPELRQYIVADNDEELPFSRDQRRWVYATSKKDDPYFGFGSDSEFTEPGYIIINHSAFPHFGRHDDDQSVPAGKVIGERRSRPRAFRPQSIVNISAMSFGALSGPATEALNRGAALAGCLHNTGEGGIADHHRHGGELIFQLGTGHFGARDADGAFSMDALRRTVESGPVRAIEIKLSQGAKPGIGGLLPGSKVTADIAAARGVPVGVTVASPARHNTFADVPGLVRFIEDIAEATGVPVGIKSAVGQMGFWHDLTAHMVETGLGPDFVTIDGGEGGTGAGPLVFTDHVAQPFQAGFAKVYSVFFEAGLQRDVVFIGSGKLGYAENAMAAMALGCDMINVGREAMMSIGCIQAQRCHSGHCPTGIATQSKWLTRGLDPTSKAVRASNYIAALRYELLRVAQAAGHTHPALVPPEAIEIVDNNADIIPIRRRYGLTESIDRLHERDIAAIS